MSVRFELLNLHKDDIRQVGRALIELIFTLLEIYNPKIEMYSIRNVNRRVKFKQQYVDTRDVTLYLSNSYYNCVRVIYLDG